MHELGVVFYVVKDVKKVAEENHVEKVSAVTLEIGEVSGILHDYLTDCWNWAKKKEPLMEEAELKIEQIEAVTFCEECQKEYPTVEHGKICPYCGSENTRDLKESQVLLLTAARKHFLQFLVIHELSEEKNYASDYL